MIKAIIFDCFGVLTADTWQEFLDNLPAGTNTNAVRKVHQDYDANLITKEECNKRIKELTGKTFIEIDDVSRDEMPKNHLLLGYIKTLKPKFKIAIASNVASSWLQDEFLTKDEQKLFDKMFLSFEMGVIKPSSAYFNKVIEGLGFKPEELVLIDDKTRYIQTAAEQGIRGVVYKNFEQMKKELDAILAKG